MVRCLDALLTGADDGEWEVVVVANGCRDDTADRVRATGRVDVRCVEIDAASKTAALNAGDAAARAYPRLYLDADVVVDLPVARRLCEALSSGEALAAAPRLRYDLAHVGRLTTRYLRVLEGLPVFESGYVGSGCYGLSAEGRGRFGVFPDVIADDRYIDQLFAAGEKLTLTAYPMTVAPPRNLRSVIRRSLRVKAGSMALVAHGPAEHRAPAVSLSRHLLRLARTPRGISDVLVFTAVQAVVIGGARLRHCLGHDRSWLRDESSRR